MKNESRVYIIRSTILLLISIAHLIIFGEQPRFKKVELQRSGFFLRAKPNFEQNLLEPNWIGIRCYETHNQWRPYNYKIIWAKYWPNRKLVKSYYVKNLYCQLLTLYTILSFERIKFIDSESQHGKLVCGSTPILDDFS